MEDSRHIDIVANAESGLRLFSCDIQPRNFMKRQGGQLFALDFRATCFVPRSFVAVAMEMCRDAFNRMVATEITYPVSDDVVAILSSNYLVQFGRNAFGKQGFLFVFRHFD